MATISLRLIGPVDLRDADGRTLDALLRRPKRIALLSYLATARPRGLHRRDTLLGLFWAEMNQEQARHALSQALHVLRQALGEAAIVTRGEGEVGLNLDLISCDVPAFEQAVADQAYENALALYRSDFLEGLFVSGASKFERWVDDERTELREKAAAMAWGLAHVRLAERLLVDAERTAQRALLLVPTDESEVRRFIKALATAGDRAAAVRFYDKFVKRLNEDYQLEPAPETVASVHAVRSLRDPEQDHIDSAVQQAWAKTPADTTTSDSPGALKPAVVASDTRTNARRGPPLTRRIVLFTATLFGIAALVLGISFSKGRNATVDSIAVLPLDNLTGNPELEYVVDGMTEALIASLGRIKGLQRVISRTSVMQYKSSDQSLPEIGRALNVAVILEGSLRAYGERLEIVVRLIDAETEERLLERDFMRARGDVLALQNEVARAVAQAVEVQLTSTEETRLTQAAQVNPEVYDLYLRGLQARASNDEPTRDLRIAYFRRAIALDPSFAPAHAALAIEYALEGGFNMLPNAEVIAEQEAQKALALDPFLSETYVALGLLREVVDYDWGGAEEAFRRAIELNPGNAFAHHELGQLFGRLGRLDEALASERHALHLDPLSARYQNGIGEILYFAGRYDEAIVELEKASVRDPGSLGNAHFYRGQYEEAREWWEMTDDPMMGRAQYAAATGERDKALATLQDFQDRLTKEGFVLYMYLIAVLWADLGENDQALDWLERAYEARVGLLVYVKVQPAFYPLHDEPRFRALLYKMGLD